MTNGFMEKLPAQQFKKIMGYDRPPLMPKFHEEFAKHGWPRDVDVKVARRLLWTGYEESRGLPGNFEIAMPSSSKEWLNQTDIIKRLNGNVRVKWYLDPARRPGDICPPVKDLVGQLPAYDRRISHSFSN